MTKNKITKYWEKFGEIAAKYGFEEITHNEVSLGLGSLCFKGADHFAPIISYNIWDDGSVSIHVKDRNGNQVIDGNTCAIHILNDCEDFEDRFDRMCKYVFDKYSKYSRENRLDFAYNNLHEERINWNDM